MSCNNSAINVVLGVMLMAVINVVVVVLLLLLTFTPVPQLFEHDSDPYGLFYLVFVLSGVGVYQLLYAVPLFLYLRRRRFRNVAKGVVIGAILTALTSGGCYLALIGGL